MLGIEQRHPFLMSEQGSILAKTGQWLPTALLLILRDWKLLRRMMSSWNNRKPSVRTRILSIISIPSAVKKPGWCSK